MTPTDWPALNRRRGYLIAKGELDKIEAAELAALNAYADAWVEATAPRPTAVLEKLEKEVMTPDELRRLATKASQGEWQLQDGCSWRRIGTPEKDGAVLCPTKASDGHPDLISTDGKTYENLRYIAACAPATVLALLDERDRLAAELGLWRPLTPAEADRELDKAESVPMSEEEIARIVAKATDPAERLTNSEQAQLAAENARLAGEVESVKKFMDGVRDAARNRNPDGATILDFMACWNEQYEKRIAGLEAEVERLRAAIYKAHGDLQHNFPEIAWRELAAALQRFCDHEWIDMRNEAVESGEWCRKCNAIRAEESRP